MQNQNQSISQPRHARSKNQDSLGVKSNGALSSDKNQLKGNNTDDKSPKIPNKEMEQTMTQ